MFGIDDLLDDKTPDPAFLKQSTKPKKNQGEADGYVKVAKRLNAWWDGVEPSEDDDDPAMDIVLDEGVRDTFENWSEARAQVAESIWGDGFINPGTGRYVKRCMAPARINKNKSVLDLTAGLGGTVVMLAREVGAWVDAIEPNPSLAGKARRLIAATPVGGQINLQHIGFESLVLQENRYHVIYSRERLFATRFKHELIEQVTQGLKSNGQFLVQDYVVESAHEDDERVRDWMSSELDEIHPWTADAYLLALTEAGFQVPPAEDFSAIMAQEINGAWTRMLHRLESGAIDRKLVNHIVVEGEIWQNRIKALESGLVKLLRFNATKR